MIQYNFLTQGIKSCITEYQNPNLEATSAFDFYCYNKQKIQKYVMLYRQSATRKVLVSLITSVWKKDIFTLIAFVFIFYVISNSSSPTSMFWFWYKVLWTKLLGNRGQREAY
jgi:hypothetical protein